MREIKFRAWCEGKHNNITFSKPHMDYDVVLSENGNWYSVEGGWDIQGEYPTIPIMQYTGLKDKNGKEIYEGDIVEYDFGNPLNREIPRPEKGEVNIKEFNWCVGDREFKFLPNTRDGKKNIEVIGNIYEDKHLLTNN